MTQLLFSGHTMLMLLLPITLLSVLLQLEVRLLQGERGVTEFTDEFDFTAMNEKFDKDEVWGSLGKEKQGIANGGGTEDDTSHYNVEVNDGYEQDPPRFWKQDKLLSFYNFIPSTFIRYLGSYSNSTLLFKSVYKKDDFFDALSCNSLNREVGADELDWETFGEFQQGPPIGGGNHSSPHSRYSRVSYNWGRGYGYYGGRGGGGG